MELIDRYLHAIRRNLPQAKADDIVAELRDDLMSRVEDREEGLGRPLGKDETSALLKEFGHPLVVAARFRNHQFLIGPALFPFYLSVMRIVLMIVVAIVIAVSIGKAVFAGNPFEAWVGSMSGIFVAVLINAAIVTIVFAILERTTFAAEHQLAWKPDQLPDVIDKQQGPWESAFEVAASIAFLLWWTGVIHLPFQGVDADFRLAPNPVFAELYWPILILASTRLVHNLIQWLRPRWKAVRGVLNVVTALGGVALLVTIYQAGRVVTVVSNGMAAAQVASLQESLDLSFRITFVVIAIIWTFGMLGGLWRMARGRAATA